MSVKITNGPQGPSTASGMSWAIHDVTEFHKAQAGNGRYRGGVVTMSLGWRDFEPCEAMQQAVNEAVASGLLIVGT